MIGKLKGLIESIGEDHVLLDVSGVCYLVHLSSRSLQQLTSSGEAISVFIETHVREDHIHLYGFLTENEKRWFNTLCTVQGVGAKMALGILSSFMPNDLVQAIHSRDTKLLTRANGVGPKLAERLVTELKNKVGSLATEDVAMNAKHAGEPIKAIAPASDNQSVSEAVSALENLGYGRSDAYQVLSQVANDNPDASLEDLIRLGLQRLSA